MSRPHMHLSTAETQNQGNTLGERACIRQSKLFRTHESGNVMKGLLGFDQLSWKTNETEGAYAGRRTYDHNNPYTPQESHPHERSYDHHRDSHESTHQSTSLVHRNTRSITSSTTTNSASNTHLRALAEQRVLAAVAASQVISAMESTGSRQQRHPPSAIQSMPQGQRGQYTTTNTNREHCSMSSYKQPQTFVSTRPW